MRRRLLREGVPTRDGRTLSRNGVTWDGPKIPIYGHKEKPAGYAHSLIREDDGWITGEIETEPPLTASQILTAELKTATRGRPPHRVDQIIGTLAALHIAPRHAAQWEGLDAIHPPNASRKEDPTQPPSPYSPSHSPSPSPSSPRPRRTSHEAFAALDESNHLDEA